MLRSFLFNYRLPNEVSDDVAESIKAQVDQIESLFSTAQAKAQALRQSGKFTPAGLKDELRALAQQTESQLAALEAKAQGYLDNAAQEEHRIRPVKPAGDEVLRFLKEQEVRRWLDGQDPIQVEAMYKETIRKGGDTLIADAVENDPRPQRLVRPELVDELRGERLAQANPETARRVNELRSAHSIVTSSVKTARSELSKLGLGIVDDPIKRQATGTEGE